MKPWRILTVAVVVALVVAMGATPAFASPHNPGPRIKYKKHGQSLNWSGYAVETNLSSPQSGAVTDVKGTWVVPPVSGRSGYSAAWVGIDGYSDPTVEQIGTEQDVLSGRPTYYVWYEMYPRGSVRVPLTVGPNDMVNAEVSYSAGVFTLTIANATHGGSYTTNQTLSGANRSSAEWIVEAPSAGRILPLANYGTASFTNCYATLNGTTGPISNWPYDPMTMVTRQGQTKASVAPLTAGGTAFTDTWHHQ